MFTVEGLNDKQLGRIARNPSFVADYNHLVSSTSPAGQDPNAWEFEMVNRLKKDATQFKNRPIKEYLDWILSTDAQKIVTELGFVPIAK